VPECLIAGDANAGKLSQTVQGSPAAKRFYLASYGERGLGSRNSVRLSVRPSLRLSVTRVLCD